MKSQFEILSIARRNILKSVENLSEEQLLKIPVGFNNNILWNMGHIVGSTQKLTYGLAGLPLRVEESFPGPFGKGTSPKDWTVIPDSKQVKEYLASTISLLQQDYEKGLFKEFRTYETSFGFKINKVEDAITFITLHEGLHFGVIMALKKMV